MTWRAFHDPPYVWKYGQTDWWVVESHPAYGARYAVFRDGAQYVAIFDNKWDAMNFVVGAYQKEINHASLSDS